MAGQLALLGREERPERLMDDGYLDWLGKCRDITMSRVDHWLALPQARRSGVCHTEGRADVLRRSRASP